MIWKKVNGTARERIEREQKAISDTLKQQRIIVMKAAMKIGLTLRFISLRVPRAHRQKTRYWKIHLAIKNDRKVAHFGKKKKKRAR